MVDACEKFVDRDIIDCEHLKESYLDWEKFKVDTYKRSILRQKILRKNDEFKKF